LPLGEERRPVKEGEEHMPEPEPNFYLIEGLASGPETQIDPIMAEILSGLQGKSVEEVRSGLFKALDYGVRYALASGFVMNILLTEWRRLGGSLEDPTPWREEIELREEGEQ
jgi:hypothetical protein